MSKYQERFLLSLDEVKSKREKIKNQKKLEGKKREKEEKYWKNEKIRMEKEHCERIFSSYKGTLIDNTLENFASEVENASLPPYEVSYTLEEGINNNEASMLEKKIKTEILKELPSIPKMVLHVSVKDDRIEHGHEEGDYQAGTWVYDWTEYKFIVKITLNF